MLDYRLENLMQLCFEFGSKQMALKDRDKKDFSDLSSNNKRIETDETNVDEHPNCICFLTTETNQINQ